MAINNSVARDPRVSLEARGLLLYMLSMADDWKFSVYGLMTSLGLPKCKVLKLVTELKKAGYIYQRRPKNEGGKFTACEWDIYEEALTTVSKNHTMVKPHSGKTTVWQNHTQEKPQCGKSAPIRNTKDKEIPSIKNNQTKEEEKYKRSPAADASRACPITSVIDWLEIRNREGTQT